MSKYLGYGLLCLIWGTTWIAIKITLSGFPPFYGAAARFVVAALFLYLYARISHAPLLFSKRYLVVIAVSSFLMYVFDYGLVYWGEQYLSAGVTAIFFAPFALFTAIWSNFIFKNEPFRWNTFAGILFGFAGIFVVFYDQLVATQFDRTVILASAAIVVGATGGALAVVIIKKYAHRENAVAITLHQMLFGIFFLALFGILFENPGQIDLSPKVIGAVVYLGIAGSAIAFSIYYWLLKKMSAITLSTIIYVTPIVAVVFDYVLMGERVSGGSIIGALLIFSGIAISQAHNWAFVRELKNKRQREINEKLILHD